jgi:methyl-accepting chemotaxis protein
MNNESTLLVVFVGITGLALVVQAIVMLVAFLTMRKTIVSLQSDVQELRTTAMPILARTRETLEKVAPKIESIATDVSDLAHRLKEQSVEFEAVASEILERVHRQTSRVDNMFTGLVDGVEQASNMVADTITKPVRKITAMLSGAKAFFTVLATGRRPGEQVDVIADQDMFV